MDKSLPMPRLQLTWSKVSNAKYAVSYELFVPLDDYDIRNEPAEEGGAKLGFLKLKMSGGTTVTSERGPIMQDGVLDTPFRDGVHALRDALTLGVPAFVVYGDVVRRLGKEFNQCPEPSVALRMRSVG